MKKKNINKKKIKVIYSSTKEKTIEEVIHNLILCHTEESELPQTIKVEVRKVLW